MRLITKKKQKANIKHNRLIRYKKNNKRINHYQTNSMLEQKQNKSLKDIKNQLARETNAHKTLPWSVDTKTRDLQENTGQCTFLILFFYVRNKIFIVLIYSKYFTMSLL